MSLLDNLLEKVRKFFEVEHKRDMSYLLGENYRALNEEENKEEDFLEDSTYQFGDIIVASRRRYNKNDYTLHKDYKEGPFVVVGSDRDNLFCLYAGVNEPYRLLDIYTTIKLDRCKYKGIFSMDTYVYTISLSAIPKDEVVCYIGDLTEEDNILLNKMCEINKVSYRYVNDDVVESRKIPLDVLDIFKKDNILYLVFDKTDDSFLIMPLQKGTGDNSVSFRGEAYQIDFNGLEEVENLDEYNRIGYLTMDNLNRINILYRNYLEYHRNYGNVGRGSVIALEDSYFYINGIDGENYLCFDVSLTALKGYVEVVINDKIYYIDFDNRVNISSKNSNIKFYDQAKDNEMDEIRTLKKKYLKTHGSQIQYRYHSKNNRKKNKDNIKCGAIVADRFINTRYIVIFRHGNQLVVMKEEDYLDFDYKLETLKVCNVDYKGNLPSKALNCLLIELSENRDVIRGFVKVDTLRKLMGK